MHPNVRIDQNPTTRGAYAPSIVAEPGGALDVAWLDARANVFFSEGCPNGGDIFFSRSLDQGATWSPDVQANGASTSKLVNFGGSTTSTRINESPGLSLGAGGIICAFGADQECAGGATLFPGVGPVASRAVYFTKSTDGGATWSPDVKVNNDDVSDGSNHRRAKVVADGSTIHVVWIGLDGTQQKQAVYLARSSDDGATWTARQRVDDGADDVTRDRPGLVTIPTGGAVAVWQDSRNSGNADVFSARFRFK